MKSQTWRRQNVFNPATITKSKFSIWSRIRLWRRKNHFAFDVGGKDEGSALTRYKIMDGKIYVLDVTHYSPKGQHGQKS